MMTVHSLRPGHRDPFLDVAFAPTRHVGFRLLGIGLQALPDLSDIIEGIATVAAGRRLDLRDLAFPMKLAKVGMIDTNLLGRLTARQAAHHLIRVGREMGCALCMQVRSQTFGIVANGDV